MKCASLSAALAAAALGLCSQSAGAADLPLSSQPVGPGAIAAEQWSWSGFYFGVHGGYGLGHDPLSVPVTDPYSGATVGTLNGINSSGYILGGHAGYNWQRGIFVGGLETDLSYTAIKGSHSLSAASASPFAAPGSTISASYTDTFDYLGSARARAGVLPFGGLLIYGTGGLGWTHLTQGSVLGANAPGAFGFTSTSTTSSPWSLFGWVAGGGVEASVAGLGAPNLLVRVEYLHYDFGSLFSSSFSYASGGITTGSGTVSHAVTVDVLRGGLSVKF